MEFYSVIKSNRSLVVIVLLSFFILSSPVPGVCHSPDMKKNASIHATVISVERSGLKIRTDKGLLLVKNVATTPIFSSESSCFSPTFTTRNEARRSWFNASCSIIFSANDCN